MKPAPFRYLAARSIEEALALLAEHGDEAKVLAGGQSLVPAMNFRLAQPAVLIDLNRVPELAYVEAAASDARRAAGWAELSRGGVSRTPDRDGAGAHARLAAAASAALRIGAMTRQRAVERSAAVAARSPLLARAMPFIAHPQIRNRGTVGGSLAHADPAAELPAVALAVGARFLLRRRGGERWVAARDFYTGLFATALEPDEILAAVEIPPAEPRTGWAFEEVSRRHGDFALAGVAAGVTLDAAGRCSEARIALLGVGDRAVLAERAAAALTGVDAREIAPDGAAVREAADAAAADVDPPSDIHAGAVFRRHLVRVLVGRALVQAAREARDLLARAESSPPS